MAPRKPKRGRKPTTKTPPAHKPGIARKTASRKSKTKRNAQAAAQQAT